MWVEDAIGRVATGFAHWGGTGTGSGIRLRVNEHNVGRAAQLVRAEADRFRRKLEERREGLWVYPVGGDPVSEEAAGALNNMFTLAPDSYFERCSDYVEMLDQLAEQLDQAAATYREAEEGNRAIFASAARELM